MGAHDFGDHTVFTKKDDAPAEEPKINWGYNCLTGGIHHGRPEVIWNIPLFQAVVMFGTEGLKQLVVARIYKDACMFVEHGQMPDQWARDIRDLAGEKFEALLSAKMAELISYYDSRGWRSDVENVIEWYKEDKLNPHYKPLHGHDSINLLCRILACNCDSEVRKP